MFSCLYFFFAFLLQYLQHTFFFNFLSFPPGFSLVYALIWQHSSSTVEELLAFVWEGEKEAL